MNFNLAPGMQIKEDKPHTNGTQEIAKSVNHWNLCLPPVSRRALGGLRLFPEFGTLLAHKPSGGLQRLDRAANGLKPVT
jgi:hypothetical protein